MLKLVTDKDNLKKARRLLSEALKTGVYWGKQTFSNPGGEIPDADVYVHKAVGIWGHVAEELWNDNRYFCGFGIGEPSWQPAIEINIPTVRLLNCNGQVVSDHKGRLFLAHKGGLGGGRYSVPAQLFAELIQGFEREAVDDTVKQQLLFVLGELRRDRLPEGLAEFVKEAKKIRELRKDVGAYRSALVRAGVPPERATQAGTKEYEPGLDSDGWYDIKRRVFFHRIHEKVQTALAKELKNKSKELKNKSIGLVTKRLHGGISPDIILQSSDGIDLVLFEIKVYPDSQSTFTAIGQLVVYTAGQERPPKRVLVSKGLPRSKMFEHALSENCIEHVQFNIDKKGAVRFSGLDSLSF